MASLRSFLVFWVLLSNSLHDAAVIVPKLFRSDGKGGIDVVKYDSMVASFGGKFESDEMYHATLFLPQNLYNKEDKERLNEYQYFCEEQYRPKNSTRQLRKSLSESKPMKNTSTQNSDLRKLSDTLSTPKAILAKKGKCTFEEKALTAMKLNEIYMEGFNEFQESDIDQSELIKFLIVYDDKPELNSTLMTMSGTEVNIDIMLLFINAKDGNELTNILYERYDNATSNGDFTKIGLPISLSSHRGGTIDFDNVSNLRNISFIGEKHYRIFNWLRFTICILLILFPFVRAISLWYSAGGRIRFRNENGRITLVYIPPHRRWLARFVDQVGQDEELQVINKMSKEEVLALPELDYGQVSNDFTYSYNISCTSCSICLDDYEQGEKLRLLPCGHFFHTDCVLPWLTERQDCCPLCKVKVSSDGQTTNVEISNDAENHDG